MSQEPVQRSVPDSPTPPDTGPIEIVRVEPVFVDRMIEKPVLVPVPAEVPPSLSRKPEGEEKELTPVKQMEPEEINEKLANPPQNVNFPVKSSDVPTTPGTVKKLPKKMHFKGKAGRQRTNAEVIDLLTFVQARNGAWPNDNYVSDQMRRYYRREYPEYFRKSRKKGNIGKVPVARSTPIDLSTRRTGTST